MIVKYNNEEVEVFGRQVELSTYIGSCILIGSNFEKVDILKKSTRKLIYTVTSLSDPIYIKTLKDLNEYASQNDIDVIVVTVDLPYTLKEKENNYPNINIYSDYMYLNFAAKFGVLLEKYRILIEAIFVINEDNNISNVEYFTFESKLSHDKIKEL